MFGMKGERNKLRLIAIGGAALLVLLVLTIAFRGGGKKPVVETDEAQNTIDVKVIPAKSVSLPEEITASGTVKAIVESVMAPKLMSNVSGVYVREGDRVRKGQLLVKLEANDLQAQVSQAQATVSAARANAQRAVTAIDLQKAQTSTGIASAQAALKAAREQLSMVREGSRVQQKAQANFAVKQAEAQYKNAEVEYNRMNRLYEQDVVSKQRLEGAETVFEVAQAQLESAKAQASMTDEGSRAQEIRTAEAQERQAEEALRMANAAAVQNKMSVRNAEVAASQVSEASSALQYARVQKGYAYITAPISGVVTSRMVDPGDTVAPGVPVISVEDDSLYRLEVTVPESISELYVGKMVDVSVGSDESTGQGKVAVVSPAGDAATHKFLVRVNLPAGMGARSGDFGRIKIPVGYTAGIVVPGKAVRHDGGLTAVYVVGKDQRAQMRVVKVGRKLDDGMEILSGLTPGDLVIVENKGVLEDGVRVRL